MTILAQYHIGFPPLSLSLHKSSHTQLKWQDAQRTELLLCRRILGTLVDLHFHVVEREEHVVARTHAPRQLNLAKRERDEQTRIAWQHTVR